METRPQEVHHPGLTSSRAEHIFTAHICPHVCAMWACVPTCMHMYTYVCPYACICIDEHTHPQRYTQHLNTTSTSVLFPFPSPAVWDEGLSLGAHMHTSNVDPPQPDSDRRYLQGLPWPLALPSCWHLAHHSSCIPSYFQSMSSQSPCWRYTVSALPDTPEGLTARGLGPNKLILPNPTSEN